MFLYSCMLSKAHCYKHNIIYNCRKRHKHLEIVCFQDQLDLVEGNYEC